METRLYVAHASENSASDRPYVQVYLRFVLIYFFDHSSFLLRVYLLNIFLLLKFQKDLIDSIKIFFVLN